MLRLLKNRREKLGITYFGLQGHEVALFKSVMENAPDLAADCELREPSEAGTCKIVVVNKDSQLANSWWTSYKERHPSAVPLFLTESEQDLDDSVYCKRPFAPSHLRAAVQELVSAYSP